MNAARLWASVWEFGTRAWVAFMKGLLFGNRVRRAVAMGPRWIQGWNHYQSLNYSDGMLWECLGYKIKGDPAERKRPGPLRANCWNSTSPKQTKELLTLRCQLYLNQWGQNDNYVVQFRHSFSCDSRALLSFKMTSFKRVTSSCCSRLLDIISSSVAFINNSGRVKIQARYNKAGRLMESL